MSGRSREDELFETAGAGARLRRVAVWLFWPAAACGVIFSACSCLSTTEPVKSGGARKQQCDAQRDSALQKARPEELGIQFDLDDVTGELNRWQRECLNGPQSNSDIGKQARAVLERSWTPAQLKELSRGTFDERDAYHLRNSLLFGAIRAEITRRMPDRNDDLWQAVELFNYVIRNVELVDGHPDALPMPIFRVLLSGKGTVEDRAWFFAALLRQVQVPAVILSAPSKSGKGQQESKQPFVVGVLLENDIYLFDPKLGMPLPAPEADPSQPLVRKPATLAQFVSRPAIAKSLSIDGFDYPLKPADLKRPRVQLIGHRSVWAPHMKSLLAPLYDRCIIYVNLEDEAEGPGLINRVAGRGKPFWSKEDLEVWPWPERVFDEYKSLSANQRSKMNDLFQPFGLPRELQQSRGEGKPELIVGRQTYRQFKSRVSQLNGEYEDSVKSFGLVRIEASEYTRLHADFQSDDRAMLEAYDRADEDAEFWIGVAKIDQYLRLRRDGAADTVNDLTRRRLNDAIQSLKRYRETPRRSPRWIDQAHYVLAIFRVQRWDDLRSDPSVKREVVDTAKLQAEAALDRLKSVPRDHPQKHGFELLRRRCLARLNSPVKPRAKQTPSKTARTPVMAPKPANR